MEKTESTPLPTTIGEGGLEMSGSELMKARTWMDLVAKVLGKGTTEALIDCEISRVHIDLC